MNGFENIKERVELRAKFKEETGDNWENSQGEPEIDYVLWLESRLFPAHDVERSVYTIHSTEDEGIIKVVGTEMDARKEVEGFRNQHKHADFFYEEVTLQPNK